MRREGGGGCNMTSHGSTPPEGAAPAEIKDGNRASFDVLSSAPYRHTGALPLPHSSMGIPVL